MKKVIIVLLLLINYINVFANNKEEVILTKCVDGDTAIFNINGNDIKVRFLGIDTPESVKTDTEVQPYGIVASKYTCNKLTNAKTIILEYDGKSSLEDKYGRRLAWIWVDNNLLQEELIKLGYAKVKYIYDQYSYKDLLYEKEQIAKNNKVGIWNNYIPAIYTITYIFDNKKEVIKIEENNTLEEYIPNKKGYKFIGWFTEENIKFDFKTKINSDYILTAKFEKKINILKILIPIILIIMISSINSLNINRKVKKKYKKYGKI